MILCIDIGNTDIHGGVYDGERRILEFRKSNQLRPSADELGVFVIQLLQAHGLQPESIHEIAIASVVPDCNDPVLEACERYLGKKPLMLQAGVRTSLKIRTRNPNEVGADRIANAIAAVHQFPGQDLVIVDLGTATTFCVVNRQREYLGGIISAGMNLSMRALAQGTAKLPNVDIAKPTSTVGKTTVECIQNGLFFGHLGMMRELLNNISTEVFNGQRPLVIGTGGHARYFQNENIFDAIIPDLVLLGLVYAANLNRQPETV